MCLFLDFPTAPYDVVIQVVDETAGGEEEDTSGTVTITNGTGKVDIMALFPAGNQDNAGYIEVIVSDSSGEVRGTGRVGYGGGPE